MSNWSTVQFSDIADFKNGLNFKSGETGHALKVLGVGDFQNRTFLDQVDEISTVHTEKEINSSYHLQDGDLVFVRSNGNKALVGRCMLVRDAKEKISFSGFTIRARLTTSDILPAFVNLLMQAGVLRKELKRDGRGTNISNLNQDMLSKIEIPLISIDQQREILDFFSNWNKAIEKTEALIDAKERQFGWLVTRLINKSGHKKKQLSDFISEVSVRNRGNEIDRVLSVTNHSGFVLPEDQFERRVASANVSNYKIVQQGQYAYNPSRINVGSIARLDDWDNGILSPMYTVFKLDQKIAHSDYFLHWLSSSEAKQRIKKSAQGSVRATVSFGDLGAIPICLPELSVQQNIANTLNTAQQEVTLLKKLADQYRTQKRGLMQKLLSGEWHIKNKEAA
ncbi:MAG: hypothetical protein GKR98_12995 [Boseongicola sp.]|nr:hypothetical protein [Rhizobiaceae bacterium]QMU59026.1 MAG: hypothetical protein GKR98_12995 [Boseongicola sp.]